MSARRVKTVLGIDVGTSAVKAMLLDADGTVRGVGRQAYPTRHAAPGLSEQSPNDWRQAAAVAVRQALADGGSEVQAIGLSGHMSAPVLVDGAGEALAPCHTLTDGRAEADLPADCRSEILALTGNVCAAHFTLPKLVWWQRHHPGVLQRTRCILSPKDFLGCWLTGVLRSDPTDAGNTLLLDPVSRCWRSDLARAAGVSPDHLPPLIEPGDALGRLRPATADILGLPAGLPVAMGAADMAAALLGTGVDADEIAVTIGTSATVIAGIPRVDMALSGRVTFHPGAAAGTLFVLGSHFSGGACLDWLAAILGGADRLVAVAADAAAMPAAAPGPLFVPYLLGAGSPDFQPAARGAFLDLAGSHGPADLFRAVVEGITADVCQSIDLIDTMPPPRPLVLAGGGANIRIWPQALADLAGRPVRITATVDASTKGAALLAGVSLGWFGGSAGAATGRARERGSILTPASPERSAVTRHRFAIARRAALAA